MTFGSTAPLTVGGTVVPIAGYPRYDNPWSHTPFGSSVVTVADRESGVRLDFGTGRRTVVGVPPGHDDQGDNHQGDNHQGDHHDDGHPGHQAGFAHWRRF
jgi:hypothetical protein